MRRHQFLMLLGSIAIGWSVDVVAQKSDRVRRIGGLMPFTADNAVGLRRAKTFTQALQNLGWTDGQNTIDYRWPGGDIEQIQSLAKELGRLHKLEALLQHVPDRLPVDPVASMAASVTPDASSHSARSGSPRVVVANRRTSRLRPGS